MKRLRIAVLIIPCLLSIACAWTAPGGSDLRDVDATIESLHTQQTSLAATLTEISGPGEGGPAAPLLPAATQPSGAEPVDFTPEPSAPVGVPAASPTPDPLQRQLKSARILLFENMSASGYIRIAKEALDRSGYFYQDVGSATGWFKTQLLSDVDWDLVIASAEADREFGGEFMGFIDQQLEDGATAVIEYWDYDVAPYGIVDPLFNRCGIRFQSDWYDPQSRALFGLQMGQPVLSRPNKIPAGLPNAQTMWQGDLGDLFSLDPAAAGMENPAVLLIGTNPAWQTDHAALVSCLGGRLILQSFRTHEYSHDVMVDLWENYIENALRSKFSASPEWPPSPRRTAQPTQVSPPAAAGPTPGPEYTLDHRCGDFFSLHFSAAPQEQRDLFEHHAEGTFVLLQVQIRNTADFPVMVWDQDYSLQAKVGESLRDYTPQPAATGYLYIDRAGDLIQGVIPAGAAWSVNLAFDVDPRTEDRVFIFRPGSEFGEQVCEVRIPLER